MTIAGDLACAVAALPDDLALDFLRGYHSIMCDCGNDNQADWWADILHDMRISVSAAQRQPSVIPHGVLL
jgi:hypothetical protein